MFYDIFLGLCIKKGVKPGPAAEECGINRSNVSLWKSKGYTPRGDALNALAEYFGVSTDYLLGKEKSPESKELTEQLGDFEFALFGEVKDLTDAEKRDILKFIKFTKEQRGEK